VSQARRGLLLHIVGPDGVGKSTLARCLLGRLDQTVELHHSYWRPGLLPMPGTLVGKSPIGLVTDPHGRSPHGFTKAMLRLAYYAVDFLVGYWVVYWPILRRGGNIIVERGWQDLVVDSRRYLMPNRFPARVLGAVIPRPDVIVILEAPVEIILERKRELTADEIARQLHEWKHSAKARRGVLHLDARAEPGKLATAVINYLEATRTGASF
jgi:thymidylate kinase